MNINNIEIGKKYKWKQLCETLGIRVSDGTSRKKDIKELESLCKYNKEGVWFTIEEIYEKPLPIEDKRRKRTVNKKKNGKYAHLNNDLTKEERCGEFNGYYVYAHYEEDEVVYIGKGCRDRICSTVSRTYDLCTLTKGVILKRFTDEKEALEFEEKMIKYYQSIGQCKFNTHHTGDKKEKKKFSIKR